MYRVLSQTNYKVIFLFTLHFPQWFRVFFFHGAFLSLNTTHDSHLSFFAGPLHYTIATMTAQGNSLKAAQLSEIWHFPIIYHLALFFNLPNNSLIASADIIPLQSNALKVLSKIFGYCPSARHLPFLLPLFCPVSELLLPFCHKPKKSLCCTLPQPLSASAGPC